LKSCLRALAIEDFPAIPVVEHKVAPTSLHNMLAGIEAQEAAPGPVHEFVPSDQVFTRNGYQDKDDHSDVSEDHVYVSRE